jgi:DNA-binding PadR family transcriptional regulator
MKPQWFHMLLALSEGDLHGFGIQRAVLERTDGHMRLWPAMLYRSLNRLEAEGLIRQIPAPETQPEDERRQYYSLTRDGRTRLAEEAEMLAQWAAAARSERPS